MIVMNYSPSQRSFELSLRISSLSILYIYTTASEGKISVCVSPSSLFLVQCVQYSISKAISQAIQALARSRLRLYRAELYRRESRVSADVVFFLFHQLRERRSGRGSAQKQQQPQHRANALDQYPQQHPTASSSSPFLTLSLSFLAIY